MTTEISGGRPERISPDDVQVPSGMLMNNGLAEIDDYRRRAADSQNTENRNRWHAGRAQHGSRWPDGGEGGGGSAEFGDLATVRRFAEQVCALGEGSDFVQTIHACAGLQDMVRDFGGDMNRAAAALVDAAVAVARDGEALREQATQVAALAQDMSGA